MKRLVAASMGALFLAAVLVSPSVSLHAAAADKTVNGTVSAVAVRFDHDQGEGRGDQAGGRLQDEGHRHRRRHQGREDEGRQEAGADRRLREGRRSVMAKYDETSKLATEVRLTSRWPSSQSCKIAPGCGVRSVSHFAARPARLSLLTWHPCHQRSDIRPSDIHRVGSAKRSSRGRGSLACHFYPLRARHGH